MDKATPVPIVDTFRHFVSEKFPGFVLLQLRLSDGSEPAFLVRLDRLEKLQATIDDMKNRLRVSDAGADASKDLPPEILDILEGTRRRRR